jgi:hypothetical protein
MNVKLILEVEYPEKVSSQDVNEKSGYINIIFINVENLIIFSKSLNFGKYGNKILLNNSTNFIEQLEHFIQIMRKNNDETACILLYDKYNALANDFVIYQNRKLDFLDYNKSIKSYNEFVISFNDIENEPIAVFEKLLMEMRIIFNKIFQLK